MLLLSAFFTTKSKLELIIYIFSSANGSYFDIFYSFQFCLLTITPFVFTIGLGTCFFLRIYVSIKYSAFAKSAQNGVLTGVLTSGCTYVVDLVC